VAHYLAKRVLSLIPVLLVVSIVVFLLVYLTPGDPVSVILGEEANPELVRQIQEELGYHLPIHQQYFNWMADVIRGDLGESFFYDQTVVELFFNSLEPTLILAIYAQVLAVFSALGLGVLAAKYQGTFIDQLFSGFSILGISVPSFLLALLLVLVFAVQLNWLPVAGYQSLDAGIWPHIRSLILPAVALASVQTGLIMRMTRSSMLEVLKSSSIKAGRARGLSEVRLTFKHALKNAFPPILTAIGQSFGGLITGAAVVETVFNIPGIGQLIINSIARRDFLVIQGTVLIIAVFYVLINLIVDVLYGFFDPKIRLYQ
jgi:peptide/nickel transport system permease protein